MSQRLYLDHAATSPLRSEARAAVLEALTIGANASSVHSEGRAARNAIEKARAQVAALVAVLPNRVIFTSGGTEANALALSPDLGRPRLIISAIEHDSVRTGGRFAAGSISTFGVDGKGIVRLDDLDCLLATGGPSLVSVMLVNNETGVIQPVAEVAARVHAAGGLLHVDAVQAAGKLPLDMAALGADLLTLSAHKIGGPQGIGALVVRSGLEPDPLIRGGGQERARRAGTEALALIAGFGAAAERARQEMDHTPARISRLREQLEAGLLAASPASRIIGQEAPRAPHIVNLVTPGLLAETAVIACDLAGLAISAGAACSSGKVRASHVLQAMGLSTVDAACGLRFSLGWTSDEASVLRAVEVFTGIAGALSRQESR